MSRYTLSPESLADLRGIRAWIAEDNPPRAASFLDELTAHFRRLAAMPMIGRRRDDLGSEVRSAVHGNFVIFYRPAEDGIIVSRVLHARRNLRGLLR